MTAEATLRYAGILCLGVAAVAILFDPTTIWWGGLGLGLGAGFGVGVILIALTVLAAAALVERLYLGASLVAIPFGALLFLMTVQAAPLLAVAAGFILFGGILAFLALEVARGASRQVV